jgi:hypothetical protein
MATKSTKHSKKFKYFGLFAFYVAIDFSAGFFGF